MIHCPVCKTDNHHLAVKCVECGAYLQNKVDNIDLFSTIWNLIEKPTKTFHKIAIAKYKNYVFILSAFAGIPLLFFIFWLIKAGDFISSLLNFIFIGFIFGPPFGIFIVTTFAVLIKLFYRIFSVKIYFKNIFAVTAYSFIPIITGVFILPLKIMTFGVHYFSMNPSPYQLKPISYVIFLILDGLFSFWTLVLLWLGMAKVSGKNKLFSLNIELVSLSVFVGFLWLIYITIPHIIK